MLIKDVLKFYKSGYAACRAIKIGTGNFSYWKMWGYIPYCSQIKFERDSKGKLSANYAHTKQGGLKCP